MTLTNIFIFFHLATSIKTLVYMYIWLAFGSLSCIQNHRVFPAPLMYLDPNMELHSREAWTTYFQNINITDDVAATYATIFHNNRITTDTLADTTTNDLCQLSTDIFGDIKAILHHARPTPPVSNPSLLIQQPPS